LDIYKEKLELAISEREKQIEIDSAITGVQVADFELKSMKDANDRLPKTFPIFEVLRAEAALKQAVANYKLQKYNLEVVKTREVTVQERELDRVKVQIETRKLIAPIDGMIVKIMAAEGEWKREGDPVLEIMQLDTMRVKVNVDPRQYAISDLDGKRATIQVSLARGKTETFQGTVFFCDPLVGGSVTYSVYIEVQNRRVGKHWLLQPGLDRVSITIHL
jgi:multidrug resistance efflux pump